MAGKEILNPAVRVSTLLGRNPAGNLQEVSLDGTGALVSTAAGGGGGTVNQGNPNTLANGWPVVLTDLINILGTSLNPLRIDPTGTTPQPISGTVAVTQSTSPWIVSAASLPLPTGAATEATLATRLADSTFTGRINTLGQKAMAASTPVVIASDQSSFPVTLASTTITGTVDVSDRAARLLGVVYGSQGQQIKQTATNFNLQVELATGATLYDARQIRALTSADVIDVTDRAARLVGQVEGRAASGTAKAGNPNQIGGVFNTTQPTVTTGQAVELQATARGAAIVATGIDTFNVTVNAALPAGTNVLGHVITDAGSVADVTDRAARLVGIVYGSQSQQLKQTVTNFNLQVELATGGTLYDARQIRALTAADVVTANQGTSPWTIQGNSASGVAKAGNPVQIGGVFNTTQPTVTNGQTVEAQSTARGAQIVATGVDIFTVAVSGTVDVSDRAARLVGIVSTKTALTASAPTASSVGVVSAQVLAANANRKGLHLTNTSIANISLGFGSSAVLNSGITLTPNGVFWMDEDSFNTAAVNAIASVAASNLAIQEYA